jgi:hypothetical protein
MNFYFVVMLITSLLGDFCVVGNILSPYSFCMEAWHLKPRKDCNAETCNYEKLELWAKIAFISAVGSCLNRHSNAMILVPCM